MAPRQHAEGDEPHRVEVGAPVDGGAGGLPIIKLDTNQRSGTIDILEGLRWLQSKGYVAKNATISQVNFGWEICSTGGVAETFEVTDYSLTATPN